MALIRQPSFTGGEYAPSLHGRDDIEGYKTAVRTARNFFVGPHGQLISRPGFLHVAESLAQYAGPKRLIPFLFSDDDSYILEFGHNRLSVFKNGAAVALNIPTVYTSAELFGIKYAQVGNILTLVHPSHPAYELTRVNEDTWTFARLNFDVPEFTNLPGWQVPLLYAVGGLPAADPPNGYYARPWTWQVTSVWKDALGRVWESKPYTVTLQVTAINTSGNPWVYTTSPVPFDVVFRPDQPHMIHIGPLDTSPTAPNHDFMGFRLYRGRGDMMGFVTMTKNRPPPWVASAAPSTTSLVDYGDTPDYSQPPPSGTNPFMRFLEWETVVVPTFGEYQRAVYYEEYPHTVAFYNQRRIFGGTGYNPDTIYASRVGDFYNFDRHKLLKEDDGFEFELASRKRERIRSLLGLDKLMALTSVSEWQIDGAGRAPISPTSVDARVITEHGSSSLDPIAVRNTILHVQAKGTVIRELEFDERRETYVGNDLSLFSKHLFDGHRIVDWTYAEDPYSVVWAVRDDGILLSLTYLPQQKIWAWTRHDSPGNQFKAVCAIPEGGEDVVYAVLNHQGDGADLHCLVRMATRRVTDAADYVGLDLSYKFDFGVGTTRVTGLLGYREGEQVYALTDGYVQGPFTVNGGVIDLTEPAVKVVVGTLYAPEVELLDVPGARTTQKVVSEIAFELETSRGLFLGESLEGDMFEWDMRDAVEGYTMLDLYTGVARVTVSGSWGLGGRAAIRQTEPLPCTLLAVAREVVAGGS